MESWVRLMTRPMHDQFSVSIDYITARQWRWKHRCLHYDMPYLPNSGLVIYVCRTYDLQHPVTIVTATAAHVLFFQCKQSITNFIVDSCVVSQTFLFITVRPTGPSRPSFSLKLYAYRKYNCIIVCSCHLFCTIWK